MQILKWKRSSVLLSPCSAHADEIVDPVFKADELFRYVGFPSPIPGGDQIIIGLTHFVTPPLYLLRLINHQES